MKKILNILMVIVLIIPYIIIPENVEAKTVGDLKKELARLEEENRKNKEEKAYTQQQINQARNQINDISLNIDQIRKDIKRLTEEIEQLNVDIVNKDEEIKKIMNFVQTANGESAYLEYTFGAHDFTDFIYRIAVSEQLANYNKKLIELYNNMIKENNEKKESLGKKTIELNRKQEELAEKIKSLGSKLNDLNQVGVTIEEDIRLQKEAIKFYQQELGCKDDEDIRTCGQNVLPPDTALFRPTNSGSISSEYGSRQYYLNGKLVSDFHRGVDIAESGKAVPIYAAGRGKVILVTQIDCGGRIVFIQHNINGKNYVTLYAHLREVYVSKNDIVDRNTQIATMGGAKTEYWDSCSTGQHLHFQISTKNFVSWADFNANSFNPREMVNFPSYGKRWSDRMTKY